MAELGALARRTLAGLLLAIGLCTAAALAQPAAQQDLSRQVKAAYLYKFAGFVEWPQMRFAHPGAVLTIGVAGDEPLAAELERAVAGRVVGGHPIHVRRLAPGASTDGLHILFIDGSVEARTFASLLSAAQGQPVLTVTDAAGARAQGCMIGFVVADQRLRFDVGLDQVAPSGLRIGARMLAVAHRVRGAS